MVSEEEFRDDVLFEYRTFLRHLEDQGILTDPKSGSRSSDDKFVWAGKTVEEIDGADHQLPFVILRRVNGPGAQHLGNGNPNYDLSTVRIATVIVRIISEKTRHKNVLANEIEHQTMKNPNASGVFDGNSYDLSLLSPPDFTTGFHDRDEDSDHGYLELSGEITWSATFGS